jgi:uncharacterized protein (DUF1778 family)
MPQTPTTERKFSTTRQKEQRLSIRATGLEKDLLARAAQMQHTNVSNFVLQTSLAAAQALLVDQTEFRLPPEEWEAFCKRLDESPKVVPALHRLFREPEVF